MRQGPLATGQWARSDVPARTDDHWELGHVFERVGAQAIVPAPAFAVFTDQPRFSEHPQMVGDAGLTYIQDTLEFGDVAFTLGKEFQNREPSEIRHGVIPLPYVRHVQRVVVRPDRPARTNSRVSLGGLEPVAAGHIPTLRPTYQRSWIYPCSRGVPSLRNEPSLRFLAPSTQHANEPLRRESLRSQRRIDSELLEL